MIPTWGAAQRGLLASLGVVLLATGCRPGASSRTTPEKTRLALAPRLGEAEIKSDSFDLTLLANRQHLRWPGWQSPRREASGIEVWTQRRSAEIRLPFFSREPKQLRIQARCLGQLAPGVELEILLNGKAVGTAPLREATAEFAFPLPEALQQSAGNVLQLRLGRAVPGTEKGREASGLVLGGLEVRRASGGAAAPPSADPERIVLPPKSAAAFAFPARGGIRLTLRLAATLAGGRLRATLEIRDQRSVVAEAVPTPGRPQELSVALPVAARMRFARLELANVGSADLRLERSALLGLAPSPPRPLSATRLEGRPSIVVFLTDTLRADRLGAYGFSGPTSPAFDAFARESILFEDAWAHAPWTRPTVASIFTGLHPSTHGAGGFANSLGDGFSTMAELYKQAGYRTGAVVANHVVSSRFGFAQGFDVWNDGEQKLYGFSAREAVERALHFVDAGPQPFFLYVHTLEPHVPYEPTDASWAPFRPPGAIRTPSLPLLMKKKTPRNLDYLHTLYLGEIRDNDQAFGSLVEGLRARGRLADTLVAFVADHGEEFGDHGGHGHGHTLYRELIRIPLAVRLPGGARAGFNEKQPVSQIDLLPTLLSLAGLPAPEVQEGRDLSALWLGRGVPDEPELVSETRFGKAEKASLRVGPLKLIVNDDTRVYGDLGGPVELYDLEADPAEKHDISEGDPIAVQYLANRLFELRSAQRRAAKTLRGGAKVELSDEDKEQLRALGYVK